MKTINVPNVNEALQIGMMLLKKSGHELFSRNGATVEYFGPVTTTYTIPWQRVLFDPLRDANPFFHFMEAMWILAGRNDVAFLNKFNTQMKKYSDDGVVFHGAYGQRMRYFPVGAVSTKGPQYIDQLNWAIEELRKDSLSRRVVVQIWDSRIDQEHHLDIPCNDLVMFRAREKQLDMTVCNRSNDIIWGCYGTNAVHFSILHEYVAARARLQMGKYHQISNSFHAYVDNPYWQNWTGTRFETDEYAKRNTTLRYPLFDQPDSADEQLYWMLECIEEDDVIHYDVSDTSNFTKIAFPMAEAWYWHRQREYVKAIMAVNKMPVDAWDWRIVCLEWLNKRRSSHEAKVAA